MIENIFPKSNFVGSFIAASPFLFDPDLTKSVILITQSNNNGYTGIKINHILHAKSDSTSYSGGQFSKKTLTMIHTPDVIYTKTKYINENLCSTVVDKDALDLKNMPEKHFSAFGYTTWTKSQLEEEITGGFWINAHCDYDIIFDVPLVNRWYYAYQKASIVPECVAIDNGRS